MYLLIIEDDKDAAAFLAVKLQEGGHHTDIAYDGENGLELALTRSYDVIICDRMLPKRDGLSVISTLRYKGNKTPALILSALGDVSDRVTGFSGGADDYLAKPYSFSELAARIELLARRKAGASERGPRIAISYRRADSDAITGRIFDRLISRYGSHSVFRDIDSIPLGTDFRVFITDELKKTDMLVAVIGRLWRGGRKKGGRPRIYNEEDLVRIEIEVALSRDIPVIPALVNGALMPNADELPDSLRNLAFRNAMVIDSGLDFDQHVERLIRHIDQSVRSRSEVEWCVGDLRLDRLAHTVIRAGQSISLQPREYRLLEYLMRHTGQVVTRTMLLENVWDYAFDPGTSVLEVCISRLRKKVDQGFAYPLLHAVRGAGYMISVPK